MEIKVWLTVAEISRLLAIPEHEVKPLVYSMIRGSVVHDEAVRVDKGEELYSVGAVLSAAYHVDTEKAHLFRDWANEALSTGLPKLLDMLKEPEAGPDTFGSAFRKIINAGRVPKK